MQDAREGFRKVRYTTALGIQGFYDALLEHAQNMAIYPDSYTILEEFMAGLPQVMLSCCFREHRLTIESNSLDEWVGAAKEIEQCDRTESYYKDRSKHRSTLASTPATSKPAARAPPAPKRGGFRTAWIPMREKEGDKPPQQPYKPREPQRGHPSHRGRKVAPISAQPQVKRCYNCDNEGHFANDCPHPKKHREFVRAACTAVGEDNPDDEENEEDESVASSEHQNGEDRRSDAKSHEIEVSAEDFYDHETADPEFLASLHAVPLKGFTGNSESTAPSIRTTNAEALRTTAFVAAGAVTPKPGGTPGLPNVKYRFQHTGKTRLRPAFSPDEKECLATWVTVGDLAAWTLWDSGSTTTGITPAFAELAKVKVDTLEDPHVLQLGTVGSRSIIKYGADTLITVAGVKATSYVDIANFDRYDMIMGTPWMRRHKVQLDFDANRVIVNGTPIPAIKVTAKDLDPRLRRHHTTDRHRGE